MITHKAIRAYFSKHPDFGKSQFNAINKFDSFKIISVLDSIEWKKCAIRFAHGLGDEISLWKTQAINKLRNRYPGKQILVSDLSNFGTLVGWHSQNEDFEDCDIYFRVNFPMAEFDEGTLLKPEKSILTEFGFCKKQIGQELHYGDESVNNLIKNCNFKFDKNFRFRDMFGKYRGRFSKKGKIIGVHFHSNCNMSFGVDSGIANLIWKHLELNGNRVLSTHINHDYNKRGLYLCESQNNIYNIAHGIGNVSKLFGVLKNCDGFVGGCSGNFHAALLALPPERILFLKTRIDVSKLTHLPIRQVNVKVNNANEIDFGIIDNWLENLSH